MTPTSPRFPLYIVSKGRHDSRLTVKALDRMGCDYRVVIEEQEFDAYASVIDPTKLLILDPEYQRTYDTFSEVGVTSSKGSGPARNFAGDHSRAAGFDYHWVMDDNIRGFCRLNRNKKIRVESPVVFRVMEDFVTRYKNIAMAGPNYRFFADARSKRPPFQLNTRIYSCNLIRNDVPLRWRGRYNEDTDLSLRMLKAGWCTVLFNAMLQDKVATQTVKGGNDEIYKDGTLAKSQQLVDMHPDVARIVIKYKRIHHHVDYRPFEKNRLIRNPDVEISEGVNDYGMVLVDGRQKSAAASV